MKIKLVRPNYATHIITPPLGLGYLYSLLRKHHHDVEIIDGLLLKLDPDRIVENSGTPISSASLAFPHISPRHARFPGNSNKSEKRLSSAVRTPRRSLSRRS